MRPTDRSEEVRHLLGCGLSTSEIADSLGVLESTAEQEVDYIMARLPLDRAIPIFIAWVKRQRGIMNAVS